MDVKTNNVHLAEAQSRESMKLRRRWYGSWPITATTPAGPTVGW
jgi:hypothetical protein